MGDQLAMLCASVSPPLQRGCCRVPLDICLGIQVLTVASDEPTWLGYDVANAMAGGDVHWA